MQQVILRMMGSIVGLIVGLVTFYCLLGCVGTVGYSLRQGLETKKQIVKAAREIKINGGQLNKEAYDKVEAKANWKIFFSMLIMAIAVIASCLYPQLLIVLLMLAFLVVAGFFGIFIVPGFTPSDSDSDN